MFDDYREADQKILGFLQEIEKKLPNFHIDRKRIMQGTGMPWTTCFDSLKRLKLKGLVTAYKLNIKRIGAPRIYYRLTADYYVLLDQVQEA